MAIGHFSFPIAVDLTKSRTITGQSMRNDTLKEDSCFLRASFS